MKFPWQQTFASIDETLEEVWNGPSGRLESVDRVGHARQTIRRIREAEGLQGILPLGRIRKYQHLPLIYVAGKFRAKSWWEMEQNIREAEDVGMRLWDAGVPAIIPHCNGRFYHGIGSDEIFLCGTLRMMAACDAVVVANEDWESSEGTVGEVLEAQRIDLPVFFWPWPHQVREFEQWLEAEFHFSASLTL